MKNNPMGESAAGLICGLIFGAGLVISGMANPARVLGFLNLAGDWDATLLFVMGGALLIGLPGFWLVRKASQPLICDTFYLPATTRIDKKPLTGAAVFGLGWGLVGLCPGPALVGLSSGNPDVLIFVAAMFVGMLLYDKGPLAR